MIVQLFISSNPTVTVNTHNSTINAHSLEFRCGLCPARVYVNQLTNLLPLLEHAKGHEATDKPQCGEAPYNYASERRGLGEVTVGNSSLTGGSVLTGTGTDMRTFDGNGLLVTKAKALKQEMEG